MPTLVSMLLVAATAHASPFLHLAPGLELADIRLPQAAPTGDSTLTIVRIDPRVRHLALFGRASGDSPKTARAFAKEHHLVAAINAGMFDPDGRTVSFARTKGAVFNGVHSHEHDELVFDPRDAKGPAARLLDDACDDRSKVEADYVSALQSIRMLDCRGQVRWSAQQKRWSVAALAIDREGRILFLHCRSPYTMREFISMLKGLGLGLVRAMYLEGGPEASLVVDTGGVTRELVGSYETGFNENDDNHVGWPLPNILGVE